MDNGWVLRIRLHLMLLTLGMGKSLREYLNWVLEVKRPTIAAGDALKIFKKVTPRNRANLLLLGIFHLQ